MKRAIGITVAVLTLQNDGMSDEADLDGKPNIEIIVGLKAQRAEIR